MSDAQPVVYPEVEFHPAIQLELEQPQISLYKTDVFLERMYKAILCE